MQHAELIKSEHPYVSEIIAYRNNDAWHTYVCRGNDGRVVVFEIIEDAIRAEMWIPIDDRDRIELAFRVCLGVLGQENARELMDECDRLGWHAPSE